MNPLVKTILMYSLKWTYNYVDKNNDGKISMSELDCQLYQPVMKLIAKINAKRNK